MPAIPCALKKRPGSLVVGTDNVDWTPAQTGPGEKINLVDVLSMQATPATAARLRIKLTKKDGKSVLLELANTADLDSARNELQSAIKRYRERAVHAEPDPVTPAPSQPAQTPLQPSAEPAQPAQPAQTQQLQTTPAEQPAAPPPAKKPRQAKPPVKKISLERGKLLHNLELQQQLLRSDPELMRTFQQVVITTGALSNEQFWSLRLDLLITAGQQQLQSTGSYNVLSTIKPITSSDNQVNINLSREKIVDLFDQYPLIRKAYNDNVPKLSEGDFWKRFFMSKLFLMLRGEKVLQNHPPDAVFDKYVEALVSYRQKQSVNRGVQDTKHPAPLFINIETNAENNPETLGNNLVTTGGPASRQLIRSMNGLSYRLLLGKRREREEDFNYENDEKRMERNLLLTDLAPESSKHKALDLKVSMVADTQSSAESNEDSRELADQIPRSIDLSDVNVNREALIDACEAVNRFTPHTSSGLNDAGANDAELENRLLTQTTTIEFLRQFWHAYASNKSEAAKLVPFLEGSLDRIEAVDYQHQLKPLSDCVQRALHMSL